MIRAGFRYFGCSIELLRSSSSLRTLTPIRLELLQQAIDHRIGTLTEIARFLNRDPSTLCKLALKHQSNDPGPVRNDRASRYGTISELESSALDRATSDSLLTSIGLVLLKYLPFVGAAHLPPMKF